MAIDTAASSPEQWQEFRDKLECEGGIEDLLNYGGPLVFPPEVRDLAQATYTALGALRAALTERGVFG